MLVKDLFALQKELDDFILKHQKHKKKLDQHSVLKKKFIALFVEIAEMCNEMPEVFKYWSDKKSDRKRVLEELVDCLHFLLSIGNELGVDVDEIRPVYNPLLPVSTHVLTTLRQVSHFCIVNTALEWKITAETIMGFAEIMGFDEDEIRLGYLEKNKKNRQRQVNGY